MKIFSVAFNRDRDISLPDSVGVNNSIRQPFSKKPVVESMTNPDTRSRISLAWLSAAWRFALIRWNKKK